MTMPTVPMDNLVRQWREKADLLEQKSRKEADYPKKIRDMWKLKALTIRECADGLEGLSYTE